MLILFVHMFAANDTAHSGSITCNYCMFVYIFMCKFGPLTQACCGHCGQERGFSCYLFLGATGWRSGQLREIPPDMAGYFVSFQTGYSQ